MNILVPMNHFEHFQSLYEAGATEFYVGFYDEAWKQKFGEYHDINRLSGFGLTANQYSLNELCNWLRQMNSSEVRKKCSIYITFNAAAYSKDQIDWLKTYFDQLKQSGMDGVIVSNPELSMLAREVDVPAVISTIAGVYNASSVKIYQKYGAKRIILPRDLSLQEMEQIVRQVPEMEYEIFLMRNGCTFSDSNCLGMHRKELCSVCGSLAQAKVQFSYEMDFKTEHDVTLNHYLYSHTFHEMTCGLCAIYRFHQLGVTACKIVGRSEEFEAICQDVRFVKRNIEIAQNCHSEKEYLERMIFPERKEEMCRLGFSCYYPEVRF